MDLIVVVGPEDYHLSGALVSLHPHGRFVVKVDG